LSILRSTYSFNIQHDGLSDGFNDNVDLLEDSDNDGVVEGLDTIGADEGTDESEGDLVGHPFPNRAEA
jgi:hypothetical protein